MFIDAKTPVLFQDAMDDLDATATGVSCVIYAARQMGVEFTVKKKNDSKQRQAQILCDNPGLAQQIYLAWHVRFNPNLSPIQARKYDPKHPWSSFDKKNKGKRGSHES
jgi:hypothetical protein